MSISSDDEILKRTRNISFLRLLMKDIVDMARFLFSSDSTGWVILLFSMYCFWQPTYEFSYELIQNKSVLISVPLLIKFAVGVITLRLSINWGKNDDV